MPRKDDLEAAFEMIRSVLHRAEHDAFQRGYEAALARMAEFAKNAHRTPDLAQPADSIAGPIEGQPVEDVEGQEEPRGVRKRAPKGLVRTVVKRALRERPGQTPGEIEGWAQTDEERLIQSSSYRSELHAGMRKGLYRNEGGRWFLAENGEAEDAHQDEPSASIFD